MAEEKPPETPPKVEDNKDLIPAAPGLMSLEELDAIIAENDPDALRNIEGVKEVAVEGAHNLELFDVDDYLNERAKKKLSARLKRLKVKLEALWIWGKNRAIESGKKFGIWTLHSAKNGKTRLQEGLRKFSLWPLKTKLGFVAGILVIISVFVFAYMAFVKKAFNLKEELFMTSLMSWSQQTYDISNEKGLESFYNSSRIPKNIFNLKRMVVNIQPSESSGSNPMVAYEFSLEGNSTEVLIEIKDREGEILDQIQRTIEDHTFDELNSSEGKKMITEKVRSTVNRLLTLGKIRYVYIQGVVFKP